MKRFEWLQILPIEDVSRLLVHPGVNTLQDYEYDGEDEYLTTTEVHGYYTIDDAWFYEEEDAIEHTLEYLNEEL